MYVLLKLLHFRKERNGNNNTALYVIAELNKERRRTGRGCPFEEILFNVCKPNILYVSCRYCRRCALCCKFKIKSPQTVLLVYLVRRYNKLASQTRSFVVDVKTRREKLFIFYINRVPFKRICALQ